MKKNVVFPFSISLLASLNANSSVDAVMKHKVTDGETFSMIVKNYIENKESKKVSYRSSEFKKVFKSFKTVNTQIKDFNTIYPGQEIAIPSEFKMLVQDTITDYRVKSGDTIYTILSQNLKGENPWRIVPVLKHLNPNLDDIDLIRVGDILKIPSRKYLVSLKSPAKSRTPSSEDFEITQDRSSYKSNFLVEEEIYYLRGIDAQEFTSVFKDVVNANTKTDVIKGLKSALELSRDYNRIRIEESILTLISSSFKSKNDDDHYLSDIRVFLKSWKSVRSQRRKNIEGL
jgi:hypothetical protein